MSASSDANKLEELKLELRELKRARSADDAIAGVRNTVAAARTALRQEAAELAGTWDRSSAKPPAALERAALLHVLASESFEAALLEGIGRASSSFSQHSRAELDKGIAGLERRIAAAELELERRAIEDRIAAERQALEALGAT